jgi:hypothetical protein
VVTTRERPRQFSSRSIVPPVRERRDPPFVSQAQQAPETPAHRLPGAPAGPEDQRSTPGPLRAPRSRLGALPTRAQWL